MNLELSGRTALVTGASRGIGLAITRALAAEGVTVVAGARTTTPELARLTETGTVRPVNADLSTADGPARLVEAALGILDGRLDILVNNVGGVHPRIGGVLSVTDEQWWESLNLNLLSAVRTTGAALPALLEHTGSIVFVGSVNSALPDPLVIDYSAAKAALASYAKSLSKEVGPRGVRVNVVSPGPVSTDLWIGAGGVAETIAGASDIDPADVAKGAVSGTATGRFTRPDEVADLVLLLAGGRAGNVTGADFVIDGGLLTML